MPYPQGMTAYRGGARGAASGLSNVGRAASSAASAMNARTGLAPFVPATSPATALGIIARAFPWLLLGLTAYELYKLWNAKGVTASCGVPIGGMGGGFLTCGSTVSNALATQAVNYTSPTLSIHWYQPVSNPTVKQITGSFTTPNPFIGTPTAPRPKLANYKIPLGNFPEEAFSPEPWFDPWQTPINRPMPDLPPLPWRVRPHVPERRAPGDPIQPSKTPRPAPRPGPRPGPNPGPRPGPNPGPRPGPSTDPLPRPDPLEPVTRPADPSTDPTVDPFDPLPEPGPQPDPRDPTTRDPDADTQTRPRPRREEQKRRRRKAPKRKEDFIIVRNRPAALKPPGRHNREVKLRSRAAGIVWTIANNITEARDFIDALWDALPKEFKSKKKTGGGPKQAGRSGPTVQEMLKDLYKAIPELSKIGDARSSKYWNDALDNLITNQIKDYVIGAVGSKQAGVNQEMGRPVGLGAGPAL